jgi:hypothetical protein
MDQGGIGGVEIRQLIMLPLLMLGLFCALSVAQPHDERGSKSPTAYSHKMTYPAHDWLSPDPGYWHSGYYNWHPGYYYSWYTFPTYNYYPYYYPYYYYNYPYYPYYWYY